MLTTFRYRIYASEVLLYIWFAAFAYDEFSEFMGAGTMVYSVDIWNGFDTIIILIGAAFMVTSEFPTKHEQTLEQDLMNQTGAIGLIHHDDEIVNTAFDILSLEALFMVPRYVEAFLVCQSTRLICVDFARF